jgi:glycosyltransferase involved in cell wall biosynthesis
MSDTSPSRPLSIAYLSGSPRIATRDDAEVAGPRSHILGLIDALRRDGHRVEEFILGDLLHQRVSGEGSLRLITGGWLRQLAVDIVRLGLRWSVARRSRRHLSGPFDVVYERFALFQHVGRGFQRTGTPWIVETNAVISQEARLERNTLALQRLAGWLERRTYRRADLVVCVSESLRELLIEQAGVPADKVVVVTNAVDVERFGMADHPAGEVGASAGGDGRELVIGYVGWVTERQGLDQLIRAVAAARARGLSVRAVIVGDGPDRPRLEAEAATEGVADHIAFPGQVAWSEVPRWIETFSVGYSGQRGVGGMPMYHSPLKIYEYLAVGRPVIASHHPDAAATLLGARAGWTFAAGDDRALLEAIVEVAELGADVLSAHGDRARRQIEEHHTWKHRSRQLLAELTERKLVS